MDVRGRRLRKQSDETTAFVSSMAFDGRIARHVVKTNMAHLVSLLQADQIPKAAGARCLRFLAGTSPAPRRGVAAEDFHQELEQRAVDSLGVKVAGYINLGKSRNDQVATAIRMATRELVIDLLEAVAALQDAALGVARRYGASLVPGYTHLQRAQPVTLAHHFFAYADSLQRDAERLVQLYARLNVSPMGSAALGGTEVAVDRRLVARLLGFTGVTANAMDGVASRDLVMEAISCACLVMIDVSRLAEEQVLWSSKEFGFMEVADAYAASSSIMPQKKNPVVAEIARAKCGSVLGSLVAVASILKSLPYSYNLDLQETTPHLWSAMDGAITSATMMALALSTAKFNLAAIRASMADDYSTATSLANHLVRSQGVSFREAHAIVGELVKISADEGVPLGRVAADRIAAVSSRLAKKMVIDRKTAEKVLDPEAYLRSIRTEGGSNPGFTARGVRSRAAALARTRASVSKLRASLAASDRMLQREVAKTSPGVRR